MSVLDRHDESVHRRAPAASDPVLARLPYEIEGRLGAGVTGVVYAARHRRSGARVAIRVLDPSAAAGPDVRRRLLETAPIIADLAHPGIARLLDYAADPQGCVLVSERLEGPAFPGAGARMAPDAAVAAVTAVCRALAEGHRHGLVHGDVRAGSVLVSAAGVPVLADLGVAEILTGGRTVARASGPAAGDASEAADAHAAAAILHALLTAHRPAPRGDPPPLGPGVPRPVADVVTSALARGPVARAGARGSAGPGPLEAAAALAAALEAAGTEAWGPEWAARTAALSEVRVATGRFRRARPATAPPRRHPADAAAATRPAEPPRRARPSRPRRAAGRRTAGALAVGGLVVAAAVAQSAGEPARSVRRDVAVAFRLPLPRTTGLASWRASARPPDARSDAAAAAASGRLWVAGGLIAGSRTSPAPPLATDRVESFDPRRGAWRARPPLPLPLHAAMATADGGAFVVLGGWIPRADSPEGEVSGRVFASRGGAWKELAPLPEPRTGGGAATVAGRIVVAGGHAYGRLIAPTDVHEASGWRRGAPIPTPRVRPAVVGDGRYVYVLGGEGAVGGAPLRRVERYDPLADRWIRMPDMPSAAAGAGAAYAAGKLFVAGGEGPHGALAGGWVYNLAEHRWSRLQPLATARDGMAFAALGRTLYAVGGAPASGAAAATTAAEALRLP